MRLLLLLGLVTVEISLAREVDFCFANDEDPYLNMATKTSYAYATGSTSRLKPVQNCVPQQIWMVSRHAARYPSSEKIAKIQRTLPNLRDQIIENHEERRLGRMCNEDLENLKSWRLDPNMREDNGKDVTAKGLEEVKLFARRLQLAYPDLFKHNDGFHDFSFASTNTRRTQHSMEAFEEAILGRRDPTASSSGEGTFLQIYKNCSHWQEGEMNDANAVEEQNKFIKSPEFVNLIHNVSRRMGFKYDLSADLVQLVYDMCRYQQSWDLKKTSPWCAVFDREDFKILEYAEDLLYYYGSGYGREINTQLGCFPLQDMVHHFKSLERRESDGQQPKGIFYFGHSVTVLSLLTSMGVMKDNQMLLPTNYKDMTNRKWRTSFIGPFNTNLIAVFYRCQETEFPNKVMFYLQEKPLYYEGCQAGLCDWEYLKHKFQNVLDQCNANICTTTGSSSSHLGIINFLLFLPIFVGQFVY